MINKKRSLGSNTRSSDGYEFEFGWRQRIFERQRNIKKVKMFLGNEQRLTKAKLRQKSPGPDLVVEISGKTKAEAERLRDQVVNAIKLG